MDYMRKCVTMLTAFSLAVSMLTAVPAGATVLTSQSETPSEAIVDPEGDAAALGDTDEEEGTASAGADVEAGEEDVLATVSGEVSGEPDDGGDTVAATETNTGDTAADIETDDGGDTVAPGTTDTGNTAADIETDDGGDTVAPGTTDNGDTGESADSGENELPGGGETDGQTDVPEESALPFEDVPVSHWSYPFVLYAYEHDLIKGVSETAFNPTGVMTRAAFVTALYRLSARLDADMSAGEVAFTDIGDINAEFQSAVRWAASHGIVTGRSDEIFAPRENVTRQQMCAILTRYLRDYLRYDLSAYAGETSFADSDTISNYAQEAVSIARNMGIIDGREVDGVTIFDPAGSASRAAVVKVLSIAVQKMPELTQLPETPATDTGNTDTGESTDTGNTDAGENTDTGNSTDTGESTDTGDTKKSGSGGSGGGSGGSGGSSGGSGGSSGGSGSGGSSGSSGGNSGGSGGSSGGNSGGSGGSSGGNSGGNGGNTATINPSEPPEAAQIFENVNDILEKYNDNPPQDEFVKGCMDVLIPDLNKLIEARNSGALADASYVEEHFKEDMETLMKKYDKADASDLMHIMEYIQSLGESRSELLEILEYFGIMKYLLG